MPPRQDLPRQWGSCILHSVKRIIQWCLCGLLCVNSWQAFSATSFLKTIRFEHGIPIAIRSGDSFMVIEFDTHESFVVHWDNGEVFQVRAPYRSRVFHRSTQTTPQVFKGEMREHYRYESFVDNQENHSRRLHNIGSMEQLELAPFLLHWSNAGAGKASWLYLRNDPPIDLILTLADVVFEDVDWDYLESLTSEVNVFSVQNATRRSYALNRMVPRSQEGLNAPRIVGMTQKGSDVVLQLEGLIPGKRCFFERSSTMGGGN